MLSNNQLNEIIQKFSENYNNEELFYVEEGHQMPSRDEIIHILLGLRQIMFPGYFDEEKMGNTMTPFFVGHNIMKIYDSLSAQIRAAIRQYCREKTTEECLNNNVDKICKSFFSKLPEIQQKLMKDAQAAYNGDPAAHSIEEIIICYPGLLAIFIYRIAHELYMQKVPLIPRIMSEYAHSMTGIDINPGATIGEYFFIDHGTGVVIGETTIIGNNVKIYQGVTLGALSTRSGQLLRDVKRHPTIEDDVTIYSSASILGGETVIGKGVVIGGNAFITESVPAGSRVSVKKPELHITEKKKRNDIFD